MTKITGKDDVTGIPIRIDYIHHETHDGSAYFAVYSALKNDTELIEVRIQTPDGPVWAHMVITIDVALAGTAQLWRGTTKTDVAGNRIASMNRDHNSSNTTGLTICHTPGGSQAGDANLLRYIGAATTSGKADVGGSGGSRGEFMLKQNTAYLIRVTSRANSNALSIVLDWYEHANK